MTEPLRPRPLLVAREFPYPRDKVFSLFTTAEHIRAWFSPEHFTVPEALVEFRIGGRFEVCMRGPDGQDFWSRGHFHEIAPPERLVFGGNTGDAERPGFSARTTITLETTPAGGTRLSVRQDYEIFDPAMLAAVDGAPEGWRTTLDKLEREAARAATNATPPAPASHDTFTLDRVYPAPLSQVWRAWTDIAAKSHWFAAPADDCTMVERSLDASPGGRERLVGRWKNGQTTAFDALYHDVVPERRLIYTYEMRLDGKKISVSLATIEFTPAPGGTSLRVTEQGVFLDGYEDKGSREHGTSWLLDRLGAALAPT